jgi:hypothetical protein
VLSTSKALLCLSCRSAILLILERVDWEWVAKRMGTRSPTMCRKKWCAHISSTLPAASSVPSSQACPLNQVWCHQQHCKHPHMGQCELCAGMTRLPHTWWTMMGGRCLLPSAEGPGPRKRRYAGSRLRVTYRELPGWGEEVASICISPLYVCVVLHTFATASVY